MQLNLFKRSAVTAGLAAMTLAVGSAQAYTFTLDVSGIFSNDELGSSINEMRFVDLLPGVQIVGLAWDVALFADAPSWLSEISVALGDATDPNRLSLSPGVASAVPGSESFSGSIDLVDQGLNFTLNVDGKSENRFSKKSVARIELPVPDGQKKVSISNTGKNLLYLRLVRTGTPIAGEETPASNGLAMQVRYKTMDGKPINPASLGQGSDFQAEVTVQNPGPRGSYQELALTQVFPSGWEIRNSRLEGTESAQENSNFNYQDIRDDRVMTYFNLSAGQSVTYRVFLNAAYTGRFHLPSTTCSAMYDNTVNARNGGQWVTVVKPGAEANAK